ncbi:MAG: hypothetical protein FJ267_18285 [Planctomycetes bacterium]|nr:hypothetical protein [Planctomycetota bacterium]
MSLHAQALKSHLRFLANRPARTDFSLLKGLSNSSGQIINFGRLDGKKALQTVCTLGPFFSPAIERQCLRMGIPIHSFSIPSATAILPYARDASFVVLRQNQGILIEMRNSHVALLTGAVLGAIHSSLGENDLYPMPSSAGPDAEITLGPVEGDVRQAKAENEVKPEAKERPAAKAARTIAPLILKALVPDELRQLVPNDAIEKLQQPPTPEQQQQKIERRKLIEERRQRRMERRRPAPAP